MVAQNYTSLSRLFDKLAPLKKICSVDDIRTLKAILRINEVIWRNNPLIFFNFQKSCMAVKHAIDEN